MLIQQGRVSLLTNLPWVAVELVSEARIEEVTLHISRWAKSRLVGEPFQLLFPVKSKDLSGVELISPYLLARSRKLEDLKGLGSIYGVVGPLLDAKGKILPIEDEFARNVKVQAEAEAEKWSAGIQETSFVRILFGPEHMLCGEVIKIRGKVAEVLVVLRTRRLKVKIPVRALLNLGNVPKDEREYFYLPK